MLAHLAAEAGVAFNGPNPWDIQVHDETVFTQILTRGSLGFGEAYINGQWSCQRLDELFTRLMRIDADTRLAGRARVQLLCEVARHRLFNLQSVGRAFQVGRQHYDIGNDVFEVMLDPSMCYSCAYWAHADHLAQAQIDKLDLICRKLELRPNESLLDIGCGWGGLARHAAENYGVHVTGLTISAEQQAKARDLCKGLPVTIELKDYRAIEGRFDKVASVGMFEHVGPKNYADFFMAVGRAIRDDGLFLLHTIGSYATQGQTDKWIDKYIFPNGKLPSARELSSALEKHFLIEDWHNFGADYDRTLMAWWRNFDSAWDTLKPKYGERFYKMWHYYLMCCAGFFRSRQGQLWQLVLSKRCRTDLYRSVR